MLLALEKIADTAKSAQILFWYSTEPLYVSAAGPLADGAAVVQGCSFLDFGGGGAAFCDGLWMRVDTCGGWALEDLSVQEPCF